MTENSLVDQVLTALQNSPYVRRRNLRFEAAGRSITLHGVVQSYFQKQMAQEALRHVEGVEEIHNELKVACAAQVSSL